MWVGGDCLGQPAVLQVGWLKPRDGRRGCRSRERLRARKLSPRSSSSSLLPCRERHLNVTTSPLWPPFLTARRPC